MRLDPKVFDDRGRAVSMATFGHTGQSGSDEATQELSRRIHFVEYETGLSRELRPSEIIYYVGFVVTMLAAAVIAQSITGPTGWVQTVLLVVVVVGSITLGRRLDRRKNAQRTVATLLSRRHCAGCGYSLAGLRVEADGCAQCAECGAAWRVDRMNLTGGVRPGDTLPDPPAMPLAARSAVTHRKGILHDSSNDVRYVVDWALRTVPIADHRLQRTPSPVSLAHQKRIDLARTALQPTPWAVARDWLAPAGCALFALFIVWRCSATPLPVGSSMAKQVATYLFAGFMIVLFCLSAYVLARGAKLNPGRPSIKHVERTLRTHGLCPSCLANTEGLAPDVKELVTCPGCGALWHARKVERGKNWLSEE